MKPHYNRAPVERTVGQDKENKASEFKRSFAGADYCTYPDCNCPFDAPEDLNWCAVGLPQHTEL